MSHQHNSFSFLEGMCILMLSHLLMLNIINTFDVFDTLAVFHRRVFKRQNG